MPLDRMAKKGGDCLRGQHAALIDDKHGLLIGDDARRIPVGLRDRAPLDTAVASSVGIGKFRSRCQRWLATVRDGRFALPPNSSATTPAKAPPSTV